MIEDLTIVIPCIDEVNLLDRCLSSIQKFLPGQSIIVIQMGEWSFDPCDGKNLNINKIYSKLLGVAAAKNLGAKAAKSKYILLLDSDNWLLGEKDNWCFQLREAISNEAKLIVLQRAEENRIITSGIKPTRWNFSRHCIGWGVIWSRKHFFELGGLDETCGTGSNYLAQAGEEFTILYKHFECFSSSTIYLPKLLVAHPSLDKPVTAKRKFEYAYGSNYKSMWQLRRSPSLMALFWNCRTLAGIINDIIRGLRSKSLLESNTLISARLLAFFDSLTRDMPRLRS